MAIPEERLHILRQIESGELSADDAALLIEGVDTGQLRDRPLAKGRPRALRVLITDSTTGRQKINVTIPAGLVDVGVRLGARLLPREANVPTDQILGALRDGPLGILHRFENLDDGETIEIVIE